MQTKNIDQDDVIQRISSPRMIASALGRLYDARGQVSLRLEQPRVTGESRIVGYDEGERKFVIDAVATQVRESIEQAHKIEVQTIIDGLMTWFHTSSIKKINEGQDRYYEIPFPDVLYKLQRRDAYRARIPGGVQSRVHVPVPQDIRQVTAALHDLSAGGACLEMKSDEASPYEPGVMVQGLEILSNYGLDLHVDAEVRHKRPERSNPSLSLVGVRFHNLTPAARQNIERAVMEIQREEMQRKDR
ncbi:MAG: flagellar brake protein [Halothiobacillaceae bacterium]|jgi:c-di-GMP-binding flagellar brake protein YcgR|nr:flagellar brake protein [Halothiobacillaceae bacterium]MDY0049817.1 flagellar brake protein [Halothiobacillaceae bacterium]